MPWTLQQRQEVRHHSQDGSGMGEEGISTLSLLLCEQFPVCEPELTCLGAIVDCLMISYEESNLFIFVKKMREAKFLVFPISTP